MIDLEAQVNVKLDKKLVSEVDRLVKMGRLKTKKEAFQTALMLLLREYKAKEIAERIERIRKGTEKFAGATASVIEAHEEE